MNYEKLLNLSEDIGLLEHKHKVELAKLALKKARGEFVAPEDEKILSRITDFLKDQNAMMSCIIDAGLLDD